jgi:transposase
MTPKGKEKFISAACRRRFSAPFWRNNQETRVYHPCYNREGWARRFFEHWRASLKWRRLKPFERFAAMIERHWDGIAAYCQPENKVALGFGEGLNNKIRVVQRRAYGLRDEEYLRL